MNAIENPTKRKPVQLCLCSQSPRRRDLLTLAGIPFRVIPFNGVETGPSDPALRASFLSQLKVAAVAKTMSPDDLENCGLLGADTLGELEGEILEKPQSRSDAYQMLNRMSGKTHLIYTAFTFSIPSMSHSFTHLEKSAVTFATLPKQQIEWYLDQNEWTDKAGSYGIQGAGVGLVSNIDGNLSSVIGLPLSPLFAHFQSLWGEHWRQVAFVSRQKT